MEHTGDDVDRRILRAADAAYGDVVIGADISPEITGLQEFLWMDFLRLSSSTRLAIFAILSDYNLLPDIHTGHCAATVAEARDNPVCDRDLFVSQEFMRMFLQVGMIFPNVDQLEAAAVEDAQAFHAAWGRVPDLDPMTLHYARRLLCGASSSTEEVTDIIDLSYAQRRLWEMQLLTIIAADRLPAAVAQAQISRTIAAVEKLHGRAAERLYGLAIRLRVSGRDEWDGMPVR